MYLELNLLKVIYYYTDLLINSQLLIQILFLCVAFMCKLIFPGDLFIILIILFIIFCEIQKNIIILNFNSHICYITCNVAKHVMNGSTKIWKGRGVAHSTIFWIWAPHDEEKFERLTVSGNIPGKRGWSWSSQDGQFKFSSVQENHFMNFLEEQKNECKWET